MYESLNKKSCEIIQRIVQGFKSYPAYREYDIKSYNYDLKMGVHALEITKNGNRINLWLFFPGINGEISSIALYGNHLQGHLNAIRSSMTVFGLPVESIEMESDFVDILLNKY